LKLNELIEFLEKEGQAPSERSARLAIVALEALRRRERQRLGKHVSPEELEEFEDALALIPDSEILELFGSDGRRSEEQGHELFDSEGKRCDLKGGDDLFDADGRRRDLQGGDDLFDADGRRRDSLEGEPPSKRLKNSESGAATGSVAGESASASQTARLALADATPEKAAQEERILARINPDAIKEHLPVLGLEDRKDNLMQIRGIGPWIQRRLNRIKIFNFQQLARMTEAIVGDVAKAIRFFPGRIHHDQWVYQAERLAGSRAWIVNPPITRSGSGHIITISGEKYERELIDIARHYGSDERILDAAHAECLWFSALDGRVVTALERMTLRYIMEKFKFDQPGCSFLTSKLAGGTHAAN